jgi:hypothetical protein
VTAAEVTAAEMHASEMAASEAAEMTAAEPPEMTAAEMTPAEAPEVTAAAPMPKGKSLAHHARHCAGVNEVSRPNPSVIAAARIFAIRRVIAVSSSPLRN